MPAVELRITGDLATGRVDINGPLPNVIVMQWLLGEAVRAYGQWLTAQATSQRVIPVATLELIRPENGGQHG